MTIVTGTAADACIREPDGNGAARSRRNRKWAGTGRERRGKVKAEPEVGRNRRNGQSVHVARGRD
ncbi:hypothetical protein PV772_11765 [Pseudarthrobacter sp. CC12]|uniref:hypothetical protein n=1 Tax=Pseudarthrobacter sp. CC12 TaxID=3029193 RepID=UPI00326678A5